MVFLIRRRYAINIILLCIITLQLFTFFKQHGTIEKSKDADRKRLDEFTLKSKGKVDDEKNNQLYQKDTRIESPLYLNREKNPEGFTSVERKNNFENYDQEKSDQVNPAIDAKEESKKDTTTIQTKTETPFVIAYVVSLIKCPASTHTTGFLDATLILRHSIDMNSYKGEGSKSKYSYKMYVIVHKNCEKFAPIFEQIGIEAMIRDPPINKNDIQNKDYRDNVDLEFCCGSDEFIKLYAYTMTQYDIVVHMDMDMILLKPLDDLYDAMLFPADSPEGKGARSRLQLEWPNYDKIPDKIDAFFTKDYTSSWPWKIEAPVQAGFLVLRPSMNAFEEYKHIITVGNYTLGNNNTSGWEGKGYGGWIGGKAMQGILPYFYDYRHKGTAVELNCCRYNQVAAIVTWNQGRKREFVGKCNRYPRQGTEPDTTCEDCRNTPISLVHSVHYTACRKPWTCAVPETGTEPRPQKRKRFNPGTLNITVCLELQREWFNIRRDLENRIIDALESSKVENLDTLKDKIVSTRTGELMTETYLGYCAREGSYNALALPKEEEFDLRLVYNNTVSDAPRDKSSYERQLQIKMKERLEKLPPPKWPQLNHGTAMSITDGMILGPECTSSLTTVVTAFYEFKTAKHSTSQYETYFPRLLQAPDPMILFVEPNSKWYSFAMERRQHAPTILIQRKFTEMVMSTTFSDNFWSKVHEIDHESFRHNTDLYKIWNEKMILMSAAIEINPFESTQFLWADAGYFRKDYLNKPKETLVANDVTKNGVDPSKVMFLHILNPVKNYPIVAAGNMYIGTGDAFSKFYDRYYQTLWFLAKKRISVGSDQHVMCYTCYYFKDVCHLHSTGKLKGWFDLSKVLKAKGKIYTDGYNSSWLDKMKTIFAPPPMDVNLELPTGVVSEYPI